VNPGIVTRIPGLRLLASEIRALHVDRTRPRFHLAKVRLDSEAVAPYPIDMSPLLALPHGKLDEHGVPYNLWNGGLGPAYQPTSVAQYGLAQWNAYLVDHDPARIEGFMAPARWLLDHETRLAAGAAVWPIPFPSPGYGAPGPWLSALTQGNVISLLVRAYLHTKDARYLECARRAARSFELDIFDGGVAAPVADTGIFFEEVATYPAARILNGYILALFGLFDYLRVTRDESIERLAQRSIDTLHDLLPGYDIGYWSRYDLLHPKPASRFYHALHIILLRALAEHTGCDHCRALADRWEAYERNPICRLRYYVSARAIRYRAKLAQLRGKRVRQAWLKTHESDGRMPVLAAITAFPVAGGMRGVLAGVNKTMSDEWRMEYLTRKVGPDASSFVIHRFQRAYSLFGPEATSPSHYPNVQFYVRAGRSELERLARQRPYGIVMPLDGAFTAAYAGPVARHYGIRVVTMDHGNVPLASSDIYAAQRKRQFATRRQPRRAIEHLRFALYLRTLRRLVREGSRATDVFLVGGDAEQEAYVRDYGVSPGLIVRYSLRMDVIGQEPPSEAQRRELRARLGLSARPIQIALISRLTDEKGFDVAIESLHRALTSLGTEVASKCGVVIAGSGPLKSQIEADIQAHGLESACMFWGEATPEQVADILRASDIFLYTGRRGASYSGAILEAMAAGCAIVATNAPVSNARLLGEGRGVVTGVDDAAALTEGLIRLISDTGVRQRMGTGVRQYIQEHHNATAVRRGILRATGWAPDLSAMAVSAEECSLQSGPAH
jgi:glycosyltransferase involved in cell wall biosynthesis